MSRSFIALLLTQFLVAMNDNMFRWLILPIGKKLVGLELAVSIGSVCFLVPFLLLAAPAGYVTDRFSKRTVMIGCKVAEIVVMVMGILVILSGQFYLMLIVLFLMGAQSAMFSPSKYGSIPEMVRHDRISAANGVIAMTTMAAIIVGNIAGGYLFTWTTVPEQLLNPAETLTAGQAILPGQHHWWISATALIGVAVLGWITSLFLGKLPAANRSRTFPWNPAAQTVRDLRVLFSRRPLLLAALGSAYFWSLGSFAQLNIDKFVTEYLHIEQAAVGPMSGVLIIGIGIGSVLAGLWSAGKIQLGLVPIGALGIALAAMLLATVPGGQAGGENGLASAGSTPYLMGCFWLVPLGLAAGLFDVPLLSFLQDRSPRESRGRILAAYNFLAFSGMLVASGLFLVLGGYLGLSARWLWLIAGLVTLPVALFIGWLLVAPLVGFLGERIVRLVYRMRVEGIENMPTSGGVLLVANHISWIDGILLTVASPRPLRFFAHADYVKKPLIRRLAKDYRAILFRPGRKSMVHALRDAQDALRQGDVVCVFPEGGLSRTGQIQAFQPGFLRMVKGTDAKLLPVYLDGVWGSLFSFSGRKFFWKWPRQFRRTITTWFGPAIEDADQAEPVRQIVQQMGVDSMSTHKSPSMTAPRKFLRMCRKTMRHPKVADSTGVELTGASLLTRTLICRRLLLRDVLKKDEGTVGLLLPPSVAGVVANAAVTLDGRVAVNLNYTVSSTIMNQCIRQAGIRTVLTSRRVMKRFPLEIDAKLIYLEDFREKVTTVDKLIAGLMTWLAPVAWLERHLKLKAVKPDDLMTLIFTSGSTGDPKGVMLTYDNVGANIEAFDQVVNIRREDVLLGILPFFHSFGYTVTLWTALTLETKVAYHFSPLEARAVGELAREHRATILISTPTFLRSYTRRCPAECFSAMDLVITGAERLPADVTDAFEKKFGIRPVQGYGTTELSPVVALNTPPTRRVSEYQQENREGTIGLPLPGIAAKVIDLETGEDLGCDKSGMLMIKGHCVMKGYLDQPELTAKLIRDGWYETGDIASINSEGYITITGRQSRFSKIGGEMVPHILVEEALAQIVAEADDEEEVTVVVTGLPDRKKGERLVVLHTQLTKTPEEICAALPEKGLPPIWIPSPKNFHQVDEIPVLGTGKLDLKRLKDLAIEEAGEDGH